MFSKIANKLSVLVDLFLKVPNQIYPSTRWISFDLLPNLLVLFHISLFRKSMFMFMKCPYQNSFKIYITTYFGTANPTYFFSFSFACSFYFFTPMLLKTRAFISEKIVFSWGHFIQHNPLNF